MSEHDNTPQDFPATQPTEPVAGSASPEQSAATPEPRRRRGLFIAGGVVAAALLVGGGVAAGAALADNDDDDHAESSLHDGDAAPSDRQDDREDQNDDGARSDGSASDSGVSGMTSAADIADLVKAASAVADGEPVSADAERDGAWEVQFETDAGDETEVRVAADGTAEVVATEPAEPDDRGPENVLDADTISSLVEAALADTDGTITELGADDGTTPYDITVLTADGRTIELDVAADFSVASRDTDD